MIVTMSWVENDEPKRATFKLKSMYAAKTALEVARTINTTVTMEVERKERLL